MKINLNEITTVTNKINNEVLVITFVDFSYIHIFKIFYKFWKTHNLDNLIVVCLDEETVNEIQKLGLHYLYYNYSIDSRPKFWEIRFDIIDDIFQISKKTLIHTDADCFWFKNIMSLITTFTEDIVYSIGTGFPQHIVNKYGFVLCSGFFMIKYKDNTKSFFSNIKQKHKLDTSKIMDDQVATNEWVFSQAVDFVRHDPISNKYCLCSIVTSTLTIACLSLQIISRWNGPPKQALDKFFCYHPYLNGDTSVCSERLEYIANLI